MMSEQERAAVGRLLASTHVTELRCALEPARQFLLTDDERETWAAIREIERRVEEFDAHEYGRKVWRHRVLTGDWVSNIGGQPGPLRSTADERRIRAESISRELLRAMARQEGGAE